jgi:protein-disulfide isomerase
MERENGMARHAKFVAIVFLTVLGTAAVTHALLTTRYRGLDFAGFEARAAEPSPPAATAPAATVPPATTPSAQTLPAPTANVAASEGIPRRHAVVFASRPFELYGLAWFLLVFALALAPVAQAPEVRARFETYVFCLAVVGLTAAAWALARTGLDWRVAGVRQLTAAVCAAGIFGVSLVFREPPARSTVRHAFRDVALIAGRATTWMVVTAFVGVVAVRAAAVTRDPKSIPTGAAFTQWFAAQPRVPIPVPAEGASVVLVKFNDYQCPPCKRSFLQYEPVLTRLMREHPGAIRVINLDYPLESECNLDVTSDIHKAACEAAVAVRLARERGRGPELERWLWDHQATLTRETVFQAARDIASIDDLPARYASVIAEVRADVETGRQLGVSSTPTYFLNGVRLPIIPGQDLETAIRSLLRPGNAEPPPQRTSR